MKENEIVTTSVNIIKTRYDLEKQLNNVDYFISRPYILIQIRQKKLTAQVNSD